MSAIRTLQRFIKEVKKYPFPDSLEPIRGKWEELSKSGYIEQQQQPWFSAFQLANLVKFLVIDGREATRRAKFDLSRPFNCYKDFWAAAESEAEYSDQEDFIAAFIFRFLYQQLPYFIHRDRVPQLFNTTRSLYLSTEQSNDDHAPWSISHFQSKAGLPLDTFLRISERLWSFFAKRLNADRESLIGCLEEADRKYLDQALDTLSADRAKFKNAYDSRKAEVFREIPYEFNPLLRFPIVVHQSKYWAPLPELIAYAATRGLYFQLADAFGEPFKKRFGDMFSSYATSLFVQQMGSSQILTEANERNLGWQGKTNDFTLIIGEKAFLFECKASALFFGSKKESSVESIVVDIRKNLANNKHRSGLFQLYDKIEAIENKHLPQSLNALYANVHQFFPVVLIYDRIDYANHPQTLRNLLDAELIKSGIHGFRYQLWHLEEIENAFELVPLKDIGSALEEKFLSAVYSNWDLNTYLFERTKRRLPYLRVSCCVPKGETQALKIIRSLADQH
jgi:hypothetical protein